MGYARFYSAIQSGIQLGMYALAARRIGRDLKGKLLLSNLLANRSHRADRTGEGSNSGRDFSHDKHQN